MDHLLLPLENLRQEVDFFAREESLRLLHVAADSALHGPALEVLRAMQWSPDNRRAVFVLEDRAGPQAEWWNALSEHFLAEFAAIRAAYAKAGRNLDDVTPPNEDEPLIRFAAILKSASEILGRPPAGTKGLVVIFATAGLEKPADWLRVLDELLNRTPSLASIRWGWMETGEPIGSDFARKLGQEVAVHVECRIDPVRQREEIEDLLAAMTEDRGEAMWIPDIGTAGPQSPPPTHPTDPPTVRTEADILSKQASRLFVQGIQAIREGNLAEAVRLQDLAFQKYLTAPNLPVAVEMELLLATYLVQAASGDMAALRSALAVYERAADRAYQAGLFVSGAKIDLVSVPLAKLVGEFEKVGRALRRAADRTKVTAPALCIESLRTAAELMIERGSLPKAVELLDEALAVAAALPPAEAKETSAARCAETRAGLGGGHGQRMIEPSP